MQTERARRHRDAFALNMLAHRDAFALNMLAKTPPLVMCAFFTHLGPHIYIIVKCLFFKVLQFRP